MAERKASAIWEGELRGGKGSLTTQSNTLNSTRYDFSSRFENGEGTNPEELLAAAHAGCYSMALAAGLSRAGHKPERVETQATCVIEPQQPSGFKITTMKLSTRANVPGISAEEFQRFAEETKNGCLVSQALGALDITLEAELL